MRTRSCQECLVRRFSSSRFSVRQFVHKVMDSRQCVFSSRGFVSICGGFLVFDAYLCETNASPMCDTDGTNVRAVRVCFTWSHPPTVRRQVNENEQNWVRMSTNTSMVRISLHGKLSAIHLFAMLSPSEYEWD